MIISALLYIFGGIVNGLVLVLPNGTALPAGIADGITYYQTIWNNWNIIFPLDSVITIIGLIIALEATVLTYHLMMWVVRLIRG